MSPGASTAPPRAARADEALSELEAILRSVSSRLGLPGNISVGKAVAELRASGFEDLRKRLSHLSSRCNAAAHPDPTSQEEVLAAISAVDASPGVGLRTAKHAMDASDMAHFEETVAAELKEVSTILDQVASLAERVAQLESVIEEAFVRLPVASELGGPFVRDLFIGDTDDNSEAPDADQCLVAGPDAGAGGSLLFFAVHPWIRGLLRLSNDRGIIRILTRPCS